MLQFSTKIEIGILLVLLIFNLLVTTHDIINPGVQYDEVFTACGTISMISKTPGWQLMLVTIPFFHRSLPVMYVPYHACLESYLLIPAFILFHFSVFSLRITPIAYSLLALLLTYVFAKYFFSRSVALITMLLLATSPFFIFYTKIGNWASSYQAFFAMGALYSFFKWYRGGSLIYYLSGMLLLGLGSSARGWFLFVPVGAVVASIVFYKEILVRIRAGRCKSFWVHLSLGFVFFCIGDFLFIYANFINTQSRFVTFHYIIKWLRHTYQGIDNLHYAYNLMLRFQTLLDMLGQNKLLFITSSPVNKCYIYGVIFAITWFIFSIFIKQERGLSKKRILFVLVFLASAFSVSAFTVSNFSPHHLFPLFPCIAILISVGLVSVSRFFREKTAKTLARVAVTIFLILLTANNIKGIVYCHMLLKKTGGAGSWSDATNALADWFKTNQHSAIFAFDPGNSRVIFFLLEGKEMIYELSGKPESGYSQSLAAFCSHGKGSMLFRMCNQSDSGEKSYPAEAVRYYLIKKGVEDSGRTLVKEKTFYRRDGALAYIVYSIH
jgi:4-amino-4-deoxy-L-arabinose transferase-like glycosyltransferase